MAKLIVVGLDQVEISHRKLEKLLGNVPRWQKEQEEMKRQADGEKARRDAEYAAQQPACREPRKEVP